MGGKAKPENAGWNQADQTDTLWSPIADTYVRPQPSMPDTARQIRLGAGGAIGRCQPNPNPTFVEEYFSP